LIHVNVAVRRSAEIMASKWDKGWFFAEVIREGRSLNTAETAV